MDMDEPPTITIVLLGDPDCGKSTFLSKLSLGHRAPSNPLSTSNPSPTTPPPLLRDHDQPFTYNIRLYNRPYRFRFSDTASSTTHYTLLEPDFVILCYAIDDRGSLLSAQRVWYPLAVREYMAERGDDVPVMLLGLKRDRRGGEEGEGVMPLEGLNVAQELRCDRYAECSAVTGELMAEVMEDIARTAAKTTTQAGGLSEGGCGVM